MNPYFLPFLELTVMLLANVSSIATSSRIIVTSLMVLSFFSTVKVTGVPFSPRISLTASSDNIPTTFTASSFGLDLTFSILSPAVNCLDFQAGAPIVSSPKCKNPFFSCIIAPMPITFPVNCMSNSSLFFGEK